MRKKLLSLLAILGVAVAGVFANTAPTFAATVTTSDCNTNVVPNEAKSKCVEEVTTCNHQPDPSDKAQCSDALKDKINACKSKTGTEKETCYKTQFGVTSGSGSDDDSDGGSTPNAPQHDDCVKTSIIGDGGQYCDENGSGIYRLLYIVINVLTMGVGVLGVLGIIISGIQYMTASGNEAQMAKSKKRIFEIVLGLVVFGVMWVVLQWLIPGGVFGMILGGV